MLFWLEFSLPMPYCRIHRRKTYSNRSFLMSIGILPWPIVFLTTDLINEYFGEKGVKKLSLITASLIAYCFIVLLFAIRIPAVKGMSPVTDDAIFWSFRAKHVDYCWEYYRFFGFPID